MFFSCFLMFVMCWKKTRDTDSFKEDDAGAGSSSENPKLSIDCNEDLFKYLDHSNGFDCDICSTHFENFDDFLIHVLDSRWHLLVWMRLRQMLAKGSSQVFRFQFLPSKRPDLTRFAFDHLNRICLPCSPQINLPENVLNPKLKEEATQNLLEQIQQPN